ncbi:hypothetical protein PTTG_09928 [Puccinia triticina 1-1 BBBD Race 1]|uniref:Uncharacterized protein n=1 Tax=Puccinia triticina (isolate 1-1 / race 1 (BBBD)) TaxID=630390 RepID=A0A180G0W5_PUCT1|nr:hypothetical protein PTTG_09928 [Puccinia triticina 1-1 BBBD Race 1]
MNNDPNVPHAQPHHDSDIEELSPPSYHEAIRDPHRRARTRPRPSHTYLLRSNRVMALAMAPTPPCPCVRFSPARTVPSSSASVPSDLVPPSDPNGTASPTVSAPSLRMSASPPATPRMRPATPPPRSTWAELTKTAATAPASPVYRPAAVDPALLFQSCARQYWPVFVRCSSRLFWFSFQSGGSTTCVLRRESRAAAVNPPPANDCPMDPEPEQEPYPFPEPGSLRDASFSARFLAANTYNFLTGFDRAMLSIPPGHPHMDQLVILQLNSSLLREWFQFHSENLVDLFEDPSSMIHLVDQYLRLSAAQLQIVLADR